MALAAAGLFAGSVFGPPLVQAATGPVTIQGASSSHKAKVNGSGELMVNGQARPLSPASPWRASEDVAAVGSVSGPVDPSAMFISRRR